MKTNPRRICAWCQTDMGPAVGNYTEDTHGICPPCREMHFGKSKMYLIATKGDRVLARVDTEHLTDEQLHAVMEQQHTSGREVSFEVVS